MISLNIKDDIAHIEINDGKANVITKDVGLAFIEALNEAKENAKATIVSGGGDKFSAGFDLSVVKDTGQAQFEMVSTGFNLLYHLYSHPQPLLAACNGHAIGMGAFILLCCDNRVGMQGDYKIGLPETAGGMPFTPLLITVLRERLNPMFHTSAALQSQMVDPKTAIKAGFLDMLVEPDQLMGAVQMGATQLMQLPHGQYGENKHMIRAKPLAEMKAQLEKLGIKND